MMLDMSNLKQSIGNQYDAARNTMGVQGSNLKKDVISASNSQLNRAGIKGTLAAASQKQAMLDADKAVQDQLSGITSAEQQAILGVQQKEVENKLAEDKANQELLFKVLSGVGTLASGFIPAGSLLKVAVDKAKE